MVVGCTAGSGPALGTEKRRRHGGRVRTGVYLMYA